MIEKYFDELIKMAKRKKEYFELRKACKGSY